MSVADPRPAAPRPRPSARLLALVVGVLVLLVLAVAGRSFGRAEPSSNYRPDLVADPFAAGCYPLPDGAHLDFPYVVRRDGNVAVAGGERRRLVLHWSLLDRQQVRGRLLEAFAQAGFDVVGPTDDPAELSLARKDPGGGVTRVSARFTELDNRSPDPIVRGVLELDLPVVGLSSDDPACANPYVTKRFEQVP